MTRESIFPFYFDYSFAKKIFLSSAPLGLMLIFNLVYFRADIILLSILSSTKNVGIYGLSYKFFDFLIALPLFLSNAVYPFLIKYRDDAPVFLSLCKKYFFIFLLSSFAVILLFWFTSPLFSLIKQDFSASVFPFRILLLSLPFFFTTSLLQWILITLKKQKYLLYVYAFSGILNIVLNIIFIPKFAYLASAFITLLSEGIVFIFLSLRIISFFKNKGEENV
jgi:O-antigen/teichoic acid export membrane protein